MNKEETPNKQENKTKEALVLLLTHEDRDGRENLASIHLVGCKKEDYRLGGLNAIKEKCGAWLREK